MVKKTISTKQISTKKRKQAPEGLLEDKQYPPMLKKIPRGRIAEFNKIAAQVEKKRQKKRKR